MALRDDGPVIIQFITLTLILPLCTTGPSTAVLLIMTTFGMRKTFETIVEVNSAARLTATKLPSIFE
jgi:hypothetical protein